MTGIYMIKNLRSGQAYVGASTSIHNRFRKHLEMLIAGAHWNYLLQADWVASGPDAFSFTILELIEKRGDLEIKEAEWIQRVLTHSPMYNRHNAMAPKSNALTGVRVRELTRDRLESLGLPSMEKAISFLLDHHERTKPL